MPLLLNGFGRLDGWRPRSIQMPPAAPDFQSTGQRLLALVVSGNHYVTELTFLYSVPLWAHGEPDRALPVFGAHVTVVLGNPKGVIAQAW